MKINRRKFIRNVGLTAAGSILAPFILPSGRLFAATGTRLVNHVVFVLFAGGIRNQESVDQQYLANQGLPTQGNIMNNMLSGAAPTQNIVYAPWTPVLSQPLQTKGSLFKELRYVDGPTGHYNGHTVAITGNYTTTGLNLYANPEFPTIFEYYRKHTDPAKSAINSWWLSESLGPYPALNYSSHPDYGPMYGANHLNASTVFYNIGYSYLSQASAYQLDDVNRISNIRSFLNNNFPIQNAGVGGITNEDNEREQIKQFLKDIIDGNISVEYATPGGNPNLLTGDLVNVSAAWQVMKTFHPELLVLNTTNLDVCHSSFSGYIDNLHHADYGIGWLWDKIQNDPVLQDDTIMICVPEHGRNEDYNAITDQFGLRAYDHTSDDNSRRLFSLIVGPSNIVKQNQVFGTQSNPVGESTDIVPTIAHILGFNDLIPAGMLPGNVLTQAFM